jgi:hypothetical protein
MIGANRTSLKALNHEKFNITDSPETYKKRIKPYAQGIPFADALPYLYNHLPNKISIRMRMIAPADLNLFFQNLRSLWLECGGQVWEGSELTPLQVSIQPQRSSVAEEDWFQLAKDLEYPGISKDQTVLKAYVYDKLGKRLGCRTAHVRKNPLAVLQIRYTNATKKVVRKVTPKKVVTKIIHHCSVCEKVGHIKVNCPRVKQTKKVNYVYQAEGENSEDPDVEYIVKGEDDEEEDDEEEDDEIEEEEEESQNCFSVKKKLSATGFL